MSLFVEVNSEAPKNCKLIINMDDVIEIAPLTTGGCVVTFNALESGSLKTIRVSDSYDQFSQFVMRQVTAESIQERFPTARKGPGRPPKNPEATTIKAQNEADGVTFSETAYGN
jgi:hypothetical protein